MKRANKGMTLPSAAVRSAACLALMSVVAPGAAEDAAEREVTFKAADGWQLTGSMQILESKGKAPGVVLVHGSKHEKDAYGQTLPRLLNGQGIAMLRLDIRGRGASREPLAFSLMAPEQRRAVRLDVEAAIDYLASQAGVDGRRIAIVAEQDSADAAVIACAKDRRVAAYVLISGRLSQGAKDAISKTPAPVFCLVSKEDRRGFKDMTDAYLSAKNSESRLKVFTGLGFGTTMFSAWQFEYPNEQSIEEMIGTWLAQRLKAEARSRIKKRAAP
ncbi:MAG TPA: hypothetical protein VNO70_05750 [Blastocatellia bacterium]|nr:hypothetical protein [Blastocatellia bacterium]